MAALIGSTFFDVLRLAFLNMSHFLIQIDFWINGVKFIQIASKLLFVFFDVHLNITRSGTWANFVLGLSSSHGFSVDGKEWDWIHFKILLNILMSGNIIVDSDK